MTEAHRSPTVRRRRLAAELRRLREAAGLTHEEVAALLGWHRSKIGRIESAQLHVTLQVLPYAAGEHAALEGSFMILGFSARAEQDVVYLDAATGGVYVEKIEDIDRYAAVFDHVRAAGSARKIR